MSNLREAAEAALEAMEINQYTVAELAPHKVVMKFNDAMTTLRAALAEPDQEDQALLEWHEEGEAIMAQAGIGFRLGGWWADRPWRKHE